MMPRAGFEPTISSLLVTRLTNLAIKAADMFAKYIRPTYQNESKFLHHLRLVFPWFSLVF